MLLAKGGVLGNPTMAAKGTVLGGATYFPKFNTIGGEAGPEGLLPLSRTSDGKLGVHVAGGGGNDNSRPEVNNYNFGDIVVMDGTDPNKIKRSLRQELQRTERARRTVQGNVA